MTNSTLYLGHPSIAYPIDENAKNSPDRYYSRLYLNLRIDRHIRSMAIGRILTQILHTGASMADFFDIGLTADGDLPRRTEHITGVDLTVQRIRTRLQAFLGEWFLDERRGLPYHTWKQTRPAPIDAIGNRVRQEIRRTPGVARVISLDVSFDSGIVHITGSLVIQDQTLTLQAELGVTSGNAQPSTILLF